MIDIRLNTLRLKNFKGQKGFTLDAHGQNVTVFGDNGVGKTTLFDAFLWALFDKDSTGRKDFSVKTHDKAGNEIHGLDHEVEATLSIDGQSMTLKKQLAEKWTKKHSEAEKKFTGHETSYWANEVPVKKNEYQAKIGSVIDENTFRLLTSPFYFNQQIDWKKRRDVLFELSGGEISDLDVIRSDASISRLESLLEGRTVDEYRKVLAERITELNKQIDKIPTRIDEQNLIIDGSRREDYALVEKNLAHFKDQLSSIESEMMSAVKSSEQLRQKQQRLFSLRDSADRRKRDLDEQANASTKRLRDEKTELLNARYQLDSEERTHSTRVDLLSQNILDIGRDLVALRGEWGTLHASQFTPPDEDSFICPTCQRPLPEDNIEQQIESMKQNFETDKAEKLARNNERGKALAAKKDSIESEANALNKKIAELQAKKTEINERLKEVEAELPDTPQQPDYLSDAEYQRIKAEITALQIELNKPVEDRSTELLTKKKNATEQIDDLNRILAGRDNAEKAKARIEELRAEETKLGAQISEQMGYKDLLDQFTKAKVGLVEGKINGMFKIVKFKLFKVLINGGVEECCEAMIDGVPYSDANHASKVNGGLDIINVLSEYYGYTAPIFIDFRESVSRLIPTKAQIINLFKNEEDKVLRVVMGDVSIWTMADYEDEAPAIKESLFEGVS